MKVARIRRVTAAWLPAYWVGWCEIVLTCLRCCARRVPRTCTSPKTASPISVYAAQSGEDTAGKRTGKIPRIPTASPTRSP